ncbi:MAG: hypothetical protein EVA58_06335 [Kiritimatiellaceae bacterium]|nr:MAG: hypothetical protein EVA58_06335 [Kiritimatiellaceae bacterium]
MDIYYVTTLPQAYGDHEVHTSTCSSLPAENRRYLGGFADHKAAVYAARHYYNQVSACAACCALAHAS